MCRPGLGKSYFIRDAIIASLFNKEKIVVVCRNKHSVDNIKKQVFKELEAMGLTHLCDKVQERLKT